MYIDILGTPYIIQRKSESEDPKLKDLLGYCDPSVKKIVVGRLMKKEDSVQDLEVIERKVMRHEIVHAFMRESGLAENSEWGTDETLIDWIAIQFPKMLKAFEDSGCI